jgi:hypothetical protein
MMEHPDEFNRLLEEWLTKPICNHSRAKVLTIYMKINTAEFIISNLSRKPKDFYLNMLL